VAQPLLAVPVADTLTASGGRGDPYCLSTPIKDKETVTMAPALPGFPLWTRGLNTRFYPLALVPERVIGEGPQEGDRRPPSLTSTKPQAQGPSGDAP
jgi:hypothetical protein